MQAMWRGVRAWLARIPEPRTISTVLTVAYVAFVLTGLATLILPPQSIVGAIGEVSMALVGWFFLAGGLIGMWAGSIEFWQLERVGITSMGAGLLAYAYIVATLHFTTEGSRLTQLGVIVIAGCLLVLRLAMIWRYDFKPRG